MRFRLIQIFLIFLVILSLITFTPIITNSNKTNQTTVVKIGIFAPYPSLSALSIYGGSLVKGFELGLMYATGNTNQTTDGRTFQLYYYDTKTDPTTATTIATNAILNDGIDTLVGGTSSTVAAALQTVAKQYQKLYFITPGADPSLTGSNFNQYSFRIARNSYQDAITTIKYAWEDTGARNYAIIAPAYSYGYSNAQAMQQEITKRAGVTVDTVYVPLGTTNFQSYMTRLINDNNTLGGVDMLIVIWAGSGFNYLFNGLADNNIANYMNITYAVSDTPTMDVIQSTFTTGSLIGMNGSAVYGYKLANNSVNDWLVNESLKNNIEYDSGYAGSATNLYGVDFSSLHVPELFTPDAFATAEFLVNITNNVPDLNVTSMICGLEGMSLLTPKGNETIRPQDHQVLSEMYVGTIINDTDASSPTYGYLIGKLLKTFNPLDIAPPIESNYAGCNIANSTASTVTTTVNQVNSLTETTTSVETQTQTQTQNQTVISTQVKTESKTDTQISKITTSTPSFLYPVTILGFITVGVAVVLRRSKRKIK